MSFKRLHHLVVGVKDIDRGIASYKALGLVLQRASESAALGIKQAFFPLADGSFPEVIPPRRRRSEQSVPLAIRRNRAFVL